VESKLLIDSPDLMAEYDADKNLDIDPRSVSVGSHLRLWWKCGKGHSWQAEIVKRKSGQQCPYCRGKKVWGGFNDLASTQPYLAAEWDCAKNGNLTPRDVSQGSPKRVWWKCEYGHSWKAPIYSRTAGTGCPKCTAALHTSFPEKAILFYVSECFPEAIGNYTDKKLGWFEVDVYIPKYKIGIEYDGQKWHKNSKTDIRKNQFCTEAGITLIRIREAGCPILDDKNSINIITNGKRDDFQKTIEQLFDILQQETHVQLPLERMVDLNRDEPKIISLMHLSIKNDNLKIKYPLIASDWDYDRNGSLLLAVISTIWPAGHMKNIVYAVVLPSFILSLVSFVSEIAEKSESDGERLTKLVDECAELSEETAKTTMRGNVAGNNGVFDLEKVITPEVNDEFERTNQYLVEAVGYRKAQIFCFRCKMICDKIMVGGYVVLFLSLTLSPYIAQWLSFINLNCLTMWSLVLLYVTLELKSEICSKVFLGLSKKYIAKAKESIEE